MATVALKTRCCLPSNMTQ